MIEADFKALLRHELQALHLDGRQRFARLRQNGNQWICESDHEELLQRLVRQIHRKANLAVEAVRLPVPELRSKVGWIHASVADVRSSPKHSAEQITQALQGESVEALQEQDGWLLSRLHDGYIGWIRQWHLQISKACTVTSFGTHCNASVNANLVSMHDAPDALSVVTGELLMGTPVQAQFSNPSSNADSKKLWLQVVAAGERSGWVPQEILRPASEMRPNSSEAILETVQRFLCVPYVWGGKSPKGFDCSGLVQFCFGLHGVALPRDSDQQFEAGQAVQQPACGDLIFFGEDKITHVGVMMNKHRFVHARGEVRINSLSPDAPDYDSELAAIHQGARRVIPPNSSQE